MKTQVVLTVDTEPSIAGALSDPERYEPLLHEPVSGKIGGKSEALGFMIESLSRHGLRATFFVEALHTRYFPPEAMGGYVEALLAADQDVQLHLHPAWVNFENGRPRPADPVSDNCSELAPDLLAALIEEGAAQIEAWSGRRPSAMRTGNFATNLGVFQAMAAVGLQASSNLCQAVFPAADPSLALTGGRHEIAGIRELPVTCFADRGPVGRGRLRPLQVTAVGGGEMIGLLRQLRRKHDDRGGLAVIVTHPFEFLKPGDFRYSRMAANRLVQNRFRDLCAFLARESEHFEVVTLGEAATRDPAARDPATQDPGTQDPSAAEPAPPLLEGSAVPAMLRAGQNFLNDRLP